LVGTFHLVLLVIYVLMCWWDIMRLVVFLGLYGLWFEDNYLSMMLYCVWINVTHWVHRINMLFDKLMGLCYETITMHDGVVCCWQLVILTCCMLEVFSLLEELLVELNVVWGFPYLGTQWRLFRLCEVVERGPLRMCEAVVEDWFEYCTLSPVWSTREGERCFHLISARCKYSARCAMHRHCTHNSLRNKGDSLAALNRTHRTICSRKLDVVVGWEAAKNQSLIIITVFEELRWMWCYAWFGKVKYYWTCFIWHFD